MTKEQKMFVDTLNGGKQKVFLNAFTIGDFALVSAPFEIFDTNAMYVREHSPYKMTFYASCTNGSNQYLATSECFDWRYSYEAFGSIGAKGAAEAVQDQHLVVLNELFGTERTATDKPEGYVRAPFVPVSNGVTYQIWKNADGSVMKAELYPETAPNTVNNFISLVNAGFYNGLIFHRVINGFMIQGGCPDGTGMGGPGYTIPGEFAMNGFQNTLKHTAGVLSMARAQHPDSAGSQFFIMHKDAPYLDGQYAAFGKITEGMDVVNKIAAVRTNFADKPLKPQVIFSMTVDTQGVNYPEPKKA
jgi:peptidyl-prolyl cis-trans isomerase B (cyclophilin B)